MAIKVIGAGMGRTGTFSLKVALEELGFSQCYHMIELLSHPEQVTFWEEASLGNPVDWDTLFQGYQATVDFPGYRYYQQLMQHYPDAKVILTVRDPQMWYESALNTIYRVDSSSEQHLLERLEPSPSSSRAQFLMRVFRIAKDYWQKDFQGNFEKPLYAIEVFNQHIEEVKQTVPLERLLVYQVKEGWEPLCRFLDVPVPNQPFPRLNDRAAFQQTASQLLS